MELLEFLAIFTGKQRCPEQFEVRLVCIEDLAELAAVVAVYQPDQVGWANEVCNRVLALFMRNFPNQFGQACFSQQFD